MSHIFDALQKAEAGNNPSGKGHAPTATELLARAERRATEQWKAENASAAFSAGEMEKLTDELPGAAADASVLSLSGISAVLNSASPEQPFATMPEFPRAEVRFSPESRLVSVEEKESAGAEAFRLLAVRLRRLRRERPLKRVLVTSTIPQEGKSFTTANLACTIASTTRQKTLLVDGDLRRASSVQVFGMKPLPGLTELLQGKQSLTASIYRLEQPGIWILPPGKGSGNPLELLQTGALNAAMSQLEKWFDWIVIDSPPILPMADTSVWERFADGIILVTRRGITRRKYLQKGLAAIEPAKLIGALLNSSSSTNEVYDYYYHRRPEGEPESSRSSTGLLS